MGSSQSVGIGSSFTRKQREDDDDEDLLDKDREEDIARFPYVEFTGQDSITCPSCQGTGCIPMEQVNELVALIPYHDQRLKPQRTKLYVLVSVLLCLLVSGLVVFFLFPHSVLVDDNGIKVVTVWFDKKNSLVTLAITATLRIRNSNFYSVAVTSLASQVQYMNTVVGTQQINNVTRIQPLSDQQFLLHITQDQSAQYCDFHEDFGEDLLHWPHNPEFFGDPSLCRLWRKFHSCSRCSLAASSGRCS
ncbi:transmembrane protein 106C isoform X2 [Elgaria multicarinata webbii]|uniref:transmembrane protein 106C isoform X2 n=1 Tax=Elgaria multicarinata webbii TaxID=159646 RepID=UPI002FCD1628